MEDPVAVGPFFVEEQIGRGGMGAVFRGRSTETDVPVAIKVIGRSTDESTRRRFHDEVQAQAQLLHPGVVYLFEYGSLDSKAASASHAAFRDGNPYVAMEFADRGTLRGAMPLSSWSSIRRVLVQILDALAYSHARGVIHRDLKPENFLLFDAEGPGDGSRLKLADFGIAHAFGVDREADTEWLSSPTGTPRYMAPEQTRGNWRAFGPWTDLYALGCVAWELICGRPPFRGDSAMQVMIRHHDEERPPLEPRVPVPGEAESWVHRAMAIEPEDRFRRAADALWALPGAESDNGGVAELLSEEGPPEGTGSIDSEMETESVDRTEDVWRPTVATLARPAATTEADALGQIETWSPFDAEESSPAPTGEEGTSGRLRPGPPPLPDSWRPGETDAVPTPLVGTGLGLFGLRETPFVDRDDERDRIWKALRHVEGRDELRIVVIVGASGSGKSRLVEWMGRRAHELGGAELIRAVHTPGGTAAGEGIPGMVRRLVRGQKLDRASFYEHLEAHLPPLDESSGDRTSDARGLTELVFPTDPADPPDAGPSFRFGSPREKCALVARLIRRYGRHRPPFVWIDDLQWGELAATLLEHLVRSSFETPSALVGVTLRSEALAEDPLLCERIESLCERESCTKIEVDTLSPSDHRRFVERLLPLEEELAGRVADRTEGNPLFATQVLGHLVDRGWLETGGSGFRLAEGASLEVPESIHDLWLRRLRRLVAAVESGDSESIWRALERTAVLGREVDIREWRAVCAQTGVGEPDPLRETLIERGLARRTETGWAFGHALLVDSIERRAREGGRLAQHHRKCAELLEDAGEERARRAAARRANHWEAAGEPDRAIAALLEEFRRLEQFGSFERMAEVLERRERLLDEANAAEDAFRRLENDVELAACRVRLGTPPEEVLEFIERVRERADRRGFDSIVAAASRTAAKGHGRLGESIEARSELSRAVEAARSGDATTELLASLVDSGWSDFYTGRIDSAEERLQEARRRASELGDSYRETLARRALAWIALTRGDYDRARSVLADVLGDCREIGSRWMEAYVHCDLGDLARYEGEADEAVRHYDRSGALVRELSRPEEMALIALKKSFVDLMTGDFDAASERLNRAESQYRELDQPDKRRFFLRLGRLAHAAGVHDWERFDRLFEACSRERPDHATLVKDHPWLLELAGSYAADAGELRRAEGARKLAVTFYDRVGDATARDRLESQLRSS